MQLITKNLALLLCLPLAALAIGCGTSASITRKGYGGAIEGRITRSTSDTVYVETAGGEIGIDRAEIVDIDHPGNVSATIGGVVAAYGVVNIISGFDTCERSGSAAYCTGVFLPAVIGASLTAYGIAVWSASTGNAAPNQTSGTGARLTVVPMANVDKKNQVYGASALVSF